MVCATLPDVLGSANPTISPRYVEYVFSIKYEQRTCTMHFIYPKILNA